jgi:signal transduction histidine kinase/ActR/RegA family two-component response regulator
VQLRAYGAPELEQAAGCIYRDQSVTSDPGINLEFLAGGGAMGARIRAYPWVRTPLSEPQFWPQGLRTAVRILLTTQHPMFIFWGREHTCLYNDAYSRSLGPEKHPSILGAPGRESWEEIWPIIGPQIEQVMRGEGATWHENHLVPIFRHGAIQDVYWTYGYSPIDEPEFRYGVGGVLVVCTETTEQVLAKQRLSAERERFVQLFDQAPTFLAVLRGPDHVIELANPEYLRLVGHRAVVGRKVADALPDALEQGYVTILDEVYRTREPFSAHGAKFARQVSPEGPVDERYVDFVYQPITDRDGSISGILVQGVDVTSRTEADRALALDRARLDYATRLSGIGFWYCDLPFDELEWDERVKEHFFFAPTARITIDDFYARIHEEDRIPTRDAIDASIGNRTPYDIVYRTVHPTTGAVKWIRALGGTDYASDGRPTRFDGVTVDVSAQKLDQQQLSALNHQLREQDRRKDEFLATLSHELRNPLAPIRTAAKIIASPQLEPIQLQRAQTIIERQVTHMALLLDDLLNIARITQGKMRLKKERVALSDVMDAAIEAARPRLDGKNHHLSVSLPTEAISLDADPLRLAQILSNLLINAAKYSNPGGHIDVQATHQADTLSVSVKDDGIGLAADSIGGIFEMFSQIEGVEGRSEGGLGIGLALVKGLAELHGGTVKAHSAGLGQGSEFTVCLPVSAHQFSSPRVTDLATMSPGRRRVLIADDNRDAAESLSQLLELSGHEVRVAHLGKTALSLAQTFRPDVAVLDIGMPDLSGYEVARALRQELWATHLQLIALTGWGQDHDRRSAMEAGFDHHLTKPIDLDQLDSLIAGRPAAVC